MMGPLPCVSRPGPTTDTPVPSSLSPLSRHLPRRGRETQRPRPEIDSSLRGRITSGRPAALPRPLDWVSSLWSDIEVDVDVAGVAQKETLDAEEPSRHYVAPVPAPDPQRNPLRTPMATEEVETDVETQVVPVLPVTHSDSRRSPQRCPLGRGPVSGGRRRTTRPL